MPILSTASISLDCSYESVRTSVARTNRFEIEEAAERLGVSREQLSILRIEEKLAQTEKEYRTAEYVLRKNAELYRRLS